MAHAPGPRPPAGGDGAATLVDARGKACPVPVIDLARAVDGVEVDARVVLLADDPGARVDVPVWCRMKRHELVEVDEQGGTWRFVVRRRG